MNGNGGYTTRNEYKSRGERTIASFLDSMKIKYIYEPGVLINDRGYQRLWYADFRLPIYDVFIEYLGIENDPVYDERTRHKLETYKTNDIDVIPVYPSTLQGDYQGHILQETHNYISKRMSALEQKIHYHSNFSEPHRRMLSRGYTSSRPRY